MPKLTKIEQPLEVHESAANIADSIGSDITGSGRQYDRRSTYTYQVDTLSASTADTLYRASDIAQVVVAMPVADALREGFKVEFDKDDAAAAKVNQRLTALNAKAVLQDAMVACRAVGGSCVLMVTNAPDYSLPMQPGETLIQLLNFAVGTEITPLTEWRSDIRAPDYGVPKFWRLEPTLFTSLSYQGNIHYSRLLRFAQPVLSRQETVTHNGVGPSIFERLWGPIRDFEIAFSTANEHLPVMNAMVRSIRGWKAALASGKTEDIKRQLKQDDRLRSLHKITVVDAGTKDEPAETLTNVSTTVTGLPEIVKLSIIRLSAGSGITPSRLVGEEAKGLNASGAASERTYYDMVANIQERHVQPCLEQLSQAVMSEMGIQDDSMSIVFNPLWQPTAQERAATDKTQTEADKLKFDMIVQDKAIYEYVLSLRTSNTD